MAEVLRSNTAPAASSIAMTVVLISFSMLFATLFLGYAVYRITSDVWPPAGVNPIASSMPVISSLLIVLSSISYLQMQKSYEDNRLVAKKWLALTTLLGVSFVVSQFFLWNDLKSAGIYSGSSIFSSIVYGFTWIHSAHMIGGLACLLSLIPTLSKKGGEIKIDNVGKFWHFLGIVWILMYVAIFVF